MREMGACVYAACCKKPPATRQQKAAAAARPIAQQWGCTAVAAIGCLHDRTPPQYGAVHVHGGVSEPTHPMQCLATCQLTRQLMAATMEPSTQKAESRSRRHSSVPNAAALTAHLVASLMASSAGWSLLRRCLPCPPCCWLGGAASAGGLSVAGVSGSAAPLPPLVLPPAAAAAAGPLRRPADCLLRTFDSSMRVAAAQRCGAAAGRGWGEAAGAGRPAGSRQAIALNWGFAAPGTSKPF